MELDHSAGSGALGTEECLIDDNSLIEADGRSEMETSFDQNYSGQGILMSDGERRPWWYLYKQNENHYGDDTSVSPDNDTDLTPEQKKWFVAYKEIEDDDNDPEKQANIRRDAATFCGHADLTDHQQQRVLYHVDHLEINEFGQCSTEAVILALIAYVANLDDRWIQRENEFRELLESLEISSDKVKRVTRKVQEKVE